MIPYSRQNIDHDDIEQVILALGSDFLTTGPAVKAFEDALCITTGAKHAVACSNGTTALHLACLALNFTKPPRAVTSPITFLASANCVEYCGGQVDFCDIDPNTLCLSPQRLEEYCKENGPPDLVVPVDFAGLPADLPAIWELAKQYGFKVIEDAAHSLGSNYMDKGIKYSCGSCAHSDLATLSFHPVKNITTGEGGAVLTNDDSLAANLRSLRSHGMTKEPSALSRREGPWYYEMQRLGFNYRITDLQCALGSSQLKKLESFKFERQRLTKAYDMGFSGIKGVLRPPHWLAPDSCPHIYPLQFLAGADTRLFAYESLAKLGIMGQVHYFPIHLQPYYMNKYGYIQGKCPHSEAYYSRCLSLPLYPGLNEEVQSEVIRCVLDVASSYQ